MKDWFTGDVIRTVTGTMEPPVKLEIWASGGGYDLNLSVDFGTDFDTVFYGTCLDTGDELRVYGWNVDVDVVGPINLDGSV